MPVGERPILEHILRRLHASGTRVVDLCIGHLGELIQAYFSQPSTLPEELELRWHWEEKPLGTAGAVRLVPDLEESFLVMNGDILTNLDYAELMRAHERHGAALTVAVHAQRVQIDLGVIDTEGERIVAYHEKPELDYEVSMGIYAYSERALARLPRDGPCQFPELVARLLEAGEEVAAHRSDAEWFDIGTPGEHQRAVDAFAQSPELFGA